MRGMRYHCFSHCRTPPCVERVRFCKNRAASREVRLYIDLKSDPLRALVRGSRNGLEERRLLARDDCAEEQAEAEGDANGFVGMAANGVVGFRSSGFHGKQSAGLKVVIAGACFLDGRVEAGAGFLGFVAHVAGSGAKQRFGVGGKGAQVGEDSFAGFFAGGDGKGREVSFHGYSRLGVGTGSSQVCFERS